MSDIYVKAAHMPIDSWGGWRTVELPWTGIETGEKLYEMFSEGMIGPNNFLPCIDEMGRKSLIQCSHIIVAQLHHY